jgi:hypothetical protein
MDPASYRSISIPPQIKKSIFEDEGMEGFEEIIQLRRVHITHPTNGWRERKFPDDALTNVRRSTK